MTAANSAVQQEAQAACLSASANITDLAAKKPADQACRAVGSGNAGQLAHAEKKLDLVDAQLAFSALDALPGPAAKGGAEALIDISRRYGLRRVEGLLLAWLDRRGLGE